MKASSYLEIVEAILRRSKKPLTLSEINSRAYPYYKGNKWITTYTPGSSLASALHTDKFKTGSIFGYTDDQPARFYIKGLHIVTNAVKIGSKPKSTDLIKNHKETDLHPLLTYFAFNKLECYTRTIHHSRSKKASYMEWTHPDIVGCSFGLMKKSKTVKDLAKVMLHSSLKLISFELKRELNRNNLREAFFQTVSNSYWAHESYLVAGSISDDEDFKLELRRLTSAFGVGVVRLDLIEPDDSETIIQAREREVLDWDGIEKISANGDFRSFIESIKIDANSSRPDTLQYDTVLPRTTIISDLRKSRRGDFKPKRK